MAIGNWGTDIVFRVSEREALLLQSLNRTVSAEWGGTQPHRTKEPVGIHPPRAAAGDVHHGTGRHPRHPA